MKKPRRRSPNMSEKDLAAHDIDLVKAMTQEHPVAAVAPVVAAAQPVVTTTTTTLPNPVHEAIDQLVYVERQVQHWLWWAFGIFLSPKPPYKPSISRISWWLILDAALLMVFQEVTHHFGNHSPSNASWSAIGIMFGAASVAVGFPNVADYWKNGGTVALGTIASAVRDHRMPSMHDDERKD